MNLKYRFIVTLISCILLNTVTAQVPTDCVDSVIVCGNSNINLDVGGIGVQAIGMHGHISKPTSSSQFADHISKSLNRQVLHIPPDSNPQSKIQTIAWCTGAAQSYIEKAVELGADAFITGEVSEQTTHIARECGIHFFAAGHHATERYGVKALGEHLSQHFELNQQFIDIDNPI